jgi:hypothetical protein
MTRLGKINMKMGWEFEPVNFHKIQWSPHGAVHKSYYFQFMIGQEMIISQKCKKSVFWGGFLIANFFFLNLFYFAKVV